jgi:hypothetical protein
LKFKLIRKLPRKQIISSLNKTRQLLQVGFELPHPQRNTDIDDAGYDKTETDPVRKGYSPGQQVVCNEIPG